MAKYFVETHYGSSTMFSTDTKDWLILTFTALEVSSVNGGMIPDNTAAIERPNKRQVARMIDVFAPRKYLHREVRLCL